jgi:sugar phosphate isomerase/epimerase
VKTSRRNFLKTTAAGAVAASFAWRTADAQAPNKSYFHGVQLGAQTYSFHEIPNDGMNHSDWIVKDLLACGLYDCELFGGPIEPGMLTGKRPPVDICPRPTLGCAAGHGGTSRNPWAWEFDGYSGGDPKAREKERAWRENVSMDYYRAIRKTFNDAGINIFSLNPLIGKDWTDRELDQTFSGAKALGAKAINTSTTFEVIKRLAPFAEKHEVIVAAHGHSETWDPEAFSTEATFERAFALSKWVGANLDIGHYTAAGGDPVAFIEKHHDRITNLHLKDRKRNSPGTKVEDGATVPWGQGDTPIKEVLLLLQKRKYPIPAFIEYEHAGTSEPVEEVKKCYAYCKQVLTAG